MHFRKHFDFLGGGMGVGGLSVEENVCTWRLILQGCVGEVLHDDSETILM